ncbi:ArsR/SmtB family transcription factor [Luedemannella flava]|uniref:ArsR/SmtB family transcription factor n=1 Tax=Luedemannella flava TaxID=349316 RepID=UPI003CD08498
MRVGHSRCPGPTISHHLKVLREAGIITGDRRGTWVYNRPVPASLQQLAALPRRRDPDRRLTPRRHKHKRPAARGGTAVQRITRRHPQRREPRTVLPTPPPIGATGRCGRTATRRPDGGASAPPALAEHPNAHQILRVDQIVNDVQ